MKMNLSNSIPLDKQMEVNMQQLAVLNNMNKKGEMSDSNYEKLLKSFMANIEYILNNTQINSQNKMLLNTLRKH